MRTGKLGVAASTSSVSYTMLSWRLFAGLSFGQKVRCSDSAYVGENIPRPEMETKHRRM